MRLCVCSLALLSILFSAAGSRAQQAESALEGSAAPARSSQPQAAGELRERLQALARSEPLDASVERPIELAKSALARAIDRTSRGDAEGAARAEKIARAAVELAEARLSLLRERALLRAAQARRREASVGAVSAQRALERERARARELEPTEARP
jgi:hypothetical protein